MSTGIYGSVRNNRVVTTNESYLRAFRDRLQLAGLTRFAPELVALARPGVRLVADGQPSAGRTSRLGGYPELPPAAGWPEADGVPLSFIAQVDLAQVSPFDVEKRLPSAGLLSFFYDAVTQGAWGFSPADSGSAAVLYTPPNVPTRHREPPSGLVESGVFTPLALRPKLEMSLPPWESFDVDQLGMSREESFAYSELLEEEDEVLHRLLGHPDPVQGDMQLECQLVTNGLYCGDSSGYQDPRAKDLRAGSSNWRLLLQVDSDEDAGMMWGDVGRLYYWIKDADLAARDWDRAWLILQCG